LAELKWADGYACKKCGNDESTTTRTLLQNLKLDILKVFGMLYEITTSKKGANSIWLAQRFGLNQKTTWAFHQKIQ